MALELAYRDIFYTFCNDFRPGPAGSGPGIKFGRKAAEKWPKSPQEAFGRKAAEKAIKIDPSGASRTPDPTPKSPQRDPVFWRPGGALLSGRAAATAGAGLPEAS